MKRRTAAPEPMPIFQLKVALLETRPSIWRRVLVPADIKLSELHGVLQEAMGWTNSHLHEFRLEDGRHFSTPHPDWDAGPEPMGDERRARLDQLLAPGQSLIYEYDFGDGWEQEVKVEKALPFDPCVSYPLCIAGARACPPEDSGGSYGYEDFLAALADPRHPEHEERRSWIGGAFDPKGFDLNRINLAFRGIRSLPGL